MKKIYYKLCAVLEMLCRYLGRLMPPKRAYGAYSAGLRRYIVTFNGPKRYL